MCDERTIMFMINDEPDARALAAIFAMSGYSVWVEREAKVHDDIYRRYEVRVRVGDHAVE